jgi:hypothetical protein
MSHIQQGLKSTNEYVKLPLEMKFYNWAIAFWMHSLFKKKNDFLIKANLMDIFNPTLRRINIEALIW